MKKKITALLALVLIFSLTACDKDIQTDDQTDSPKDWRNSIEYEGNFYVNSKTKLLYALDKGTITLWDNAGNGEKLQVLDYNSAESTAIESLEIKDINGDGSNDISTVFSENEDGTKYNLWLWDTKNSKYKEINIYRNINDPVVSEDHTTVAGTLDKGIFGVVSSVYTFTEDLTLEESSVTIANAENIAQNIAEAFSLSDITLGDGIANIQSVPCSVYIANGKDNTKAYIAHTSNGYWYIDIGCVGAYKSINDNSGAFEAGVYVDEAGEITDICASLYNCKAEELTITETSIGKLIPCAYDDEGNVIATNDLDIDTSNGDKAKGFTIERNGQILCLMLKTENNTYYCHDPDVSGDNYYHMVSAAGETTLVDFTASQYYTD